MHKNYGAHIRMHVARARKEKTRVYFLPHTRAAGYLNCEWKVCGNRGTNVFFKCSGIFRGSLFITRLRRMFYRLVSVFKNKTKKQVNV